MTIDDYLASMSIDPEFRAEYAAVESKYKTIQDLLHASRLNQNIPANTQFAVPFYMQNAPAPFMNFF